MTMMIRHSLAFFFIAGALGAQQAPAVRLIAAPEARSKPTLGRVAAVRQLPSGTVLVNDIQHRQLAMFDPTLASETIVADSIDGGANAYGPGPGGLLAYRADSSLFIDPRDLSMFVIDPQGKIARVAAVPRSQDAMAIASNLAGTAGLDASGRLIYRAQPDMRAMLPKRDDKGIMQMPDPPDSAPLVRVDLASRKLDTAAFFKVAKNKLVMNQSEGRISITPELNPMQVIDGWAVLSDGTLAIVRGRDYHVDFVGADGKLTVAPKIPFDWQRLSDDDKVAVLDSAKAAFEKARAAAVNAQTSGSKSATPGGDAPGGMRITMSFGGPGGDGGGKGAAGAAMQMPPVNMVSASELPDYRPVIGGAGDVFADRDDNLWVRTSATSAGAVAGGPIYDVINDKGELVDRVQVPAGRQIVGFGPKGVVYMFARDDSGGWLERTHR